MQFKIPSGPHALFHFRARSALYALHDKTNDSDGISGTTIAATSLGVISVKPDVSPAKNALILKRKKLKVPNSSFIAVCDELNNLIFFSLEHELGTPHAHISLEPLALPQ